MTSTTFRTQQEKPKEAPLVEKNSTQTSITNVPVPYTDYESQNGRPYTVDHYELGEYWNENGAFNEDVGRIEDYLKSKIDSGEWSNDQETIKQKLKEMEKLTNMKDEKRAVMKISTISAYIKFLMESDGIRKDFRKYGTK